SRCDEPWYSEPCCYFKGGCRMGEGCGVLAGFTPRSPCVTTAPRWRSTYDRHLLDCRHFNALCAGAGLWSPSLATLSGAPLLAADSPPRTVRFRNGTVVPAVGQGSWHLGQRRHPAALEEEALRAGMSLGMSLIDTSGNYGDGRSEQLISHVIAGQRDRVFLVSKVETDQVTGDGMARACEASLARLGTDYLDLYLLHWPVPRSQFTNVVAGFEQLR